MGDYHHILSGTCVYQHSPNCFIRYLILFLATTNLANIWMGYNSRHCCACLHFFWIPCVRRGDREWVLSHFSDQVFSDIIGCLFRSFWWVARKCVVVMLTCGYHLLQVMIKMILWVLLDMGVALLGAESTFQKMDHFTYIISVAFIII